MAGKKTMQTLDQERAAFAWQKVAEAKTKLGDKRKFDNYTNLAKSAPALIMGNGLMATLAFFQQKSEESRVLNGAICGWLVKSTAFIMGSEYATVMEGLHGADAAQYLHATEEALEILRWIRQFAPTLKG